MVLGAVVFVGLGFLDVAAKGWAEGKIEDRARAEVGAEVSTSADIDSFPFVGKLLLTGSAGDIQLVMRDVDLQRLRFSRLEVDLFDVRLDRGKAMSGDAEITDIERGVITMTFTAADLGRAVNLPVEIEDGKITVTARGVKVAATPQITAEGSLRLQVSGLPTVNVPIPRTRLVSCAVKDVKVEGGALEASCTISEIPPALLRAASRAG
jgi:LmeA-like phospholipid-binding